MNNKTKKILGLSLLTTTAITMVCALAPNPLEISTRLFASNNKQTYSYVKTDFSISELPVIPSDNRKYFGYSPMEFTEESGIFVSDVGDPSDIDETTTGIGWSTGDTANGCKVTREGNFFSLETVTPSPYKPSDANRELGVNIKIDVKEGDREILLTDNTYYLFDLYYVAQIVDEEVIVKREMKITPEYYYPDHSSVFFSLDTFKGDYTWETEEYGKILSCGVYKVTLKEISIEYSCSK